MLIRHVVEDALCCGCGACASFRPHLLTMLDDPDRGLVPLSVNGAGAGDDDVDLVKVCPGAALSHDPKAKRHTGVLRRSFGAWGPVIDLWEGHAADPDLRWAGSSGGAASAIALHCLERVGMHGVLHIAAREDAPYLNETVLSTTRQQLLARTGSRYAPASPCDGLRMIEAAPGPCVFIGKPCDVAAVQKARQLWPALDAKIGLTIAFFCAGTPTTRGTLEMLRAMGIDDPESLMSLRYRGNGWPGRATAVVRTPQGDEETRSLSYEQSWGDVLAKHKVWRCKICPDHTGEFADIAVGDPWQDPPRDEAEPGRSLVLARTERGRAAIEAAMQHGYLSLEPRPASVLPAAQPNLLKTRGAVWGRLLGLRLVGAPTPRFRGLPMFGVWMRRLSLTEKVRSIGGAARRAWRARVVSRLDARASPAASELATAPTGMPAGVHSRDRS